MIDSAPVTSSDLTGVSMPEVCTNVCPLGEKYQKYWDLLTPEEQSWHLDIEGLYSITVQQIATDQAQHLKGDIVVDLFCGCGGNTIAFARAGKKVIAIDVNEGRLEMARKNAKLAGVEESIHFIQGDAIEFLQNHISEYKPDAVFLDPPWGGPGYVHNKEFPLDGFEPDGGILLELAFRHVENVGIKLPENFVFEELDQFKRSHEKVADFLGERMLHYTVYFS